MSDPRITCEVHEGGIKVAFRSFPPSCAPSDSHRPPPPPDFVYESAFVEEPGWIMRLLGDTLEQRIERAEVEVAQRADEQMRRRERLRRAVEAVCQRECVKRA